MNDLSTIIIETNNLNKKTWANIYSLIDDFENSKIDNKRILRSILKIYFPKFTKYKKNYFTKRRNNFRKEY